MRSENVQAKTRGGGNGAGGKDEEREDEDEGLKINKRPTLMSRVYQATLNFQMKQTDRV